MSAKHFNFRDGSPISDEQLEIRAANRERWEAFKAEQEAAATKALAHHQFKGAPKHIREFVRSYPDIPAFMLRCDLCGQWWQELDNMAPYEWRYCLCPCDLAHSVTTIDESFPGLPIGVMIEEVESKLSTLPLERLRKLASKAALELARRERYSVGRPPRQIITTVPDL